MELRNCYKYIISVLTVSLVVSIAYWFFAYMESFKSMFWESGYRVGYQEGYRFRDDHSLDYIIECAGSDINSLDYVRIGNHDNKRCFYSPLKQMYIYWDNSNWNIGPTLDGDQVLYTNSGNLVDNNPPTTKDREWVVADGKPPAPLVSVRTNIGKVDIYIGKSGIVEKR